MLCWPGDVESVAGCHRDVGMALGAVVTSSAAPSAGSPKKTLGHPIEPPTSNDALGWAAATPSAVVSAAGMCAEPRPIGGTSPDMRQHASASSGAGAPSASAGVSKASSVSCATVSGPVVRSSRCSNVAYEAEPFAPRSALASAYAPSTCSRVARLVRRSS